VDQWSPTVPYLPETLIRTAARVTGLRFQEWTIWMLPFTTHELGHVLFREVEHLREFVDQRTAAIKYPEKKVRLEKQLHELLADAFATYNLGPAYPCALLVLGLNPVSVDDKTADGSTPARRAYAVLKILERMDAKPGLEKPYADLRQKLTDIWDRLLAGLDPRVIRLNKNEQAATETLVDEIWTHLDAKFTKSTAKYPQDRPCNERGWQTAGQWCHAWDKQLTNLERPLRIAPDEIGPQNLLADVLNAAWRCRLDHPGETDTESIAEAAYDLAKQLLSKRAEGAASQSKK
jgi:hypothetical protein